MEAVIAKKINRFYILIISAFIILTICSTIVFIEMYTHLKSINLLIETYTVSETINDFLFNLKESKIHLVNYYKKKNLNELTLHNQNNEYMQSDLIKLNELTKNSINQQKTLSILVPLANKVIASKKIKLTKNIIDKIYLQIHYVADEMNLTQFQIFDRQIKSLSYADLNNYIWIVTVLILSFLILVTSFILLLNFKTYTEKQNIIIQKNEKEKLDAQEQLNKNLEFSLNSAKIGRWELNCETHTTIRTLLHDKIFGYDSLQPTWTFEMFLNHIHPDSRDFVDQTFKTALATNSPLEFECKIIRDNDKSIRWAWIRGDFIKSNGTRTMLGLIQDITMRIEMDIKLQNALSYTRKLIETSLDPLVTISRDGKITDVNKATELVTGLPYEKLIGTNFSTYFTEPDRAEIGYQMVYKNGVVRDYPLTLKNISGGTRDVNYNAATYTDINGKVVGVFAAARDVTDLNKAINTLKQLAATLEQSNKDLMQFTYIASHDLQEPLRMISSYLQLIERRYKGKLDKDADDFIDFAVGGAVRLQNMINDLLMYSHIDVRNAQFSPVNFENVFKLSMKNLEILINENHAVITHDLLPNVIAVETQMIILFQNLLSNAIKFHGSEVPKIHVSTHLKGDDWEFSVTDNGIGIDPEYKENLFIAFKRLVGKEYAGTGIGLATCKRIIDIHNGKIWVESEPGKGSTFYFTIPVTR